MKERQEAGIIIVHGVRVPFRAHPHLSLHSSFEEKLAALHAQLKKLEDGE